MNVWLWISVAFLANGLVGGIVTRLIADRWGEFERWVEAEPAELGGLGRTVLFELWPVVLVWFLRERRA